MYKSDKFARRDEIVPNIQMIHPGRVSGYNRQLSRILSRGHENLGDGAAERLPFTGSAEI